MLIDSHAHLTHASFQETITAVLERAQEAGIEAIVNICTTPQEVERGFALSSNYPWVYNAAATTPHDVAQEGEFTFKTMEAYAKSGRLVAIGETGLDYYYYPETKLIQQNFLRRYFQLAIKCNLPVVIHCRQAFDDLFRIIDEEYAGKPGVLHCFTGTLEEAYQIVGRGWYLSLSGIVTFKKSTELQQVAREIPLSSLLIETDSPYLAPDPLRGKPNEPAYLPHTARFIATLRNIPLSTLASTTSSNTRSLFSLPG